MYVQKQQKVEPLRTTGLLDKALLPTYVLLSIREYFHYSDSLSQIPEMISRP